MPPPVSSFLLVAKKIDKGVVETIRRPFNRFELFVKRAIPVGGAFLVRLYPRPKMSDGQRRRDLLVSHVLQCGENLVVRNFDGFASLKRGVRSLEDPSFIILCNRVEVFAPKRSTPKKLADLQKQIVRLTLFDDLDLAQEQEEVLRGKRLDLLNPSLHISIL
jgi:hypothetical protein